MDAHQPISWEKIQLAFPQQNGCCSKITQLVRSIFCCFDTPNLKERVYLIKDGEEK